MPAHLQAFFDRVVSVKFSDDKSYVDIIDQTLLPNTEKRIALRTREEIWEAIKKLRVRGAPAIGVCAAYGLAVLARQHADQLTFGHSISGDASAAPLTEDFLVRLRADRDYLATSRPTAVNLFWALDRMMQKADDVAAQKDEAASSTSDAVAAGQSSVEAIVAALYDEALAIREEDVAISRNIGKIGLGILEEIRKKKPEGEIGIVTHCNAGTLATAMYGTATAPMYIALEQGWDPKDMHVYCDETRPLLQGARLTAYEMQASGIPTTVQCDNMASILLRTGKISVIFVGCDRVARNGDAANKIGTSGLAMIAKHYNIPFYVCAPSSTIDPAAKDIDDIPIEYRDGEEIRSAWYAQPMVPQGVECYNPAFDVTPHELVTGIITEKGLCTAEEGGDFEASFRALGLI